MQVSITKTENKTHMIFKRNKNATQNVRSHCLIEWIHDNTQRVAVESTVLMLWVDMLTEFVLLFSSTICIFTAKNNMKISQNYSSFK